jgi:hypothetical protein
MTSARLANKARSILRAAVAAARKSGLRVPAGVEIRVVRPMRGRHAYTLGASITIGSDSVDRENVVHELAHVISDQMVLDTAAAHNRFWATTYGVLYETFVQA